MKLKKWFLMFKKQNYINLLNKDGIIKRYRVYVLSDVLSSEKRYRFMSDFEKISFRNKIIEGAVIYARQEGVKVEKILHFDC